MYTISKHSVRRIQQSMYDCGIPIDYAHVVINYLLYGFHPGGFFTSLLANDAMGAFSRSHPLTDILVLKNLAVWIQNSLVYGIHYGTYEIVDEWINTSPVLKRKSLEDRNLIFDEKTELMMTLKE